MLADIEQRISQINQLAARLLAEDARSWDDWHLQWLRSIKDNAEALVSMAPDIRSIFKSLGDVTPYQAFNVISHEFRTPITSIRGHSKAMLDETMVPLSANQRRDIGRINQLAEEVWNMTYIGKPAGR